MSIHFILMPLFSFFIRLRILPFQFAITYHMGYWSGMALPGLIMSLFLLNHKLHMKLPVQRKIRNISDNAKCSQHLYSRDKKEKTGALGKQNNPLTSIYFRWRHNIKYFHIQCFFGTKWIVTETHNYCIPHIIHNDVIKQHPGTGDSHSIVIILILKELDSKLY